MYNQLWESYLNQLYVAATIVSHWLKNLMKVAGIDTDTLKAQLI